MHHRHALWRAVPLAVFFTVSPFGAMPALAESLTVAWDSSPDPTVIGYTVHIGTQSGTYVQNVNVGNVNSYIFTSALAGQRYYFAVRAYTPTLVSAYSNEVSAATNAPPTLLNPGSQTSELNQYVNLQLVASDPEGDPLTFSGIGFPPGLLLAQVGGLVTGQVVTAGTYNVTVKVADGRLSATQVFAWTVTSPTMATTDPPSTGKGRGKPKPAK
jgi:hypothetical protein